ncbi:MAG: hypothetical protein QJT81_06015 [Candidatus Thiothrix putei]|uniref:Uracil-DNA glycosylase-like domain-containing protein n=1 Tax=Candidatus Thiothrix putei TaxID=3080811 RepID=A0AA95HE02_9GAMM|nr:MAG: hypothetical protein QJT81_06015 [Candidatus Thiothrix putei]
MSGLLSVPFVGLPFLGFVRCDTLNASKKIAKIMDNNMKNLTFHPWVGKVYHNGGIFHGRKILILGESHYGADDDEETVEYTQNVVDWYGIQNGDGAGKAFFLKIAVSMLMKNASWDVSDKERIDFWNSVAFYNYIQGFVGDKPRMRPTSPQWEEAKQLFINVLDELKPDFCIAFGFSLCGALPDLNRSVQDINDYETFIYKRNDGGSTYVGCVKHPAGGLNYKDTQHRIRALFDCQALTDQMLEPAL